MKSSNLFWGFFLVTFGSLYLVARYSTFIIDWYSIWELWPILIILAGLSIIVKGTFFKPILSVLIGILLAFLAFGFFNDVFDVFESNDYERRSWREYSENYYNLDYNENIEHVNLKIKAGAGKFNIEKTTDDLIKGYSRGNIDQYNFTSTNKDSVAWVELDMKEVDFDLNNTSLQNHLQVSLNEKPTYSINLEIGAAKSYFNLIPFDVKNLVLQTGATDTKIKLGNKSKLTYVNVELGAASLQIYIPKTSGCKITGEMVMMAKDLSGFINDGSDYYYTENYESAAEKIIMEIEGGISSFEVKRY